MAEIIYPKESYMIMGACYSVYRRMGCGFLESVYQECLEMEFIFRKIHYIPQKELNLSYRGSPLNKMFMTDFICFNKIIVELKAVDNLSNKHRAQVLNYLNATGIKLGILVNFGHHPKLEYQRLVFD